MSAPTATTPRLNNGDHLTRAEFERRYHATPDAKKAELIEGVVYLPSPVRLWHGQARLDLAGWVGFYRAHTPCVLAGDNATVRLDDDNEPQPDLLLMIDPRLGGQAMLQDGYVVGGPEFVAEVAASSVSIDRNAKLRAYQRNGVREYLLWRVEDGAIDWFALREGKYEQLPPGPDGVVRSEAFAGLWLDTAAMLRRDPAGVLAALARGTAGPEHSAFVAALGRP
jgi:hypothetical protein